MYHRMEINLFPTKNMNRWVQNTLRSITQIIFLCLYPTDEGKWQHTSCTGIKHLEHLLDCLYSYKSDGPDLHIWKIYQVL